jgi:uncharacterized protein
MAKYTNSLVHETSPYLLSHAHNPVNWHAWNKDTWALAVATDKLVVISIGYAACHWCHVMEHESFSDPAVAAVMNQSFVSIKVDREERLDIDQVYMDVARKMNNTGGWPLNIITLSNGKPIFAGTYFRREQWISLLNQINRLFHEQRTELETMASDIVAAINVQDTAEDEHRPSLWPNLPMFTGLVDGWKHLFDYTHGGTQGAPKFPLPCVYQFLLEYQTLHPDKEVANILSVTLDAMACGGIYDHLGGGFARYATDGNWRVPHFEKMLYDNAQLVSLYAKAFEQTCYPRYKQVIEETLEFVKNELGSPETAFYSSIDADSEGEEGKYYAWTIDDLEPLHPDDAKLAMDYFHITGKGNWEKEKNVLFTSATDEAFAAGRGWTMVSLHQRIAKVRAAMVKIRSHRHRPKLDNKILTDWNALMLQGFLDAYMALGNEQYLMVALKNADYLRTHMMTADGKLTHNFSATQKPIDGFLDDYAFTIRAFITLFEVTCNSDWIRKAQTLTEYTLKHFYSPAKRSFYFTSNVSEKLIKRHSEMFDNVTPGSNPTMALNLFLLGEWLENDQYSDIAAGMMQAIVPKLEDTGPYGANWLRLMMRYLHPPVTVSVVGQGCVEKVQVLRQFRLPNTLIIGGNDASIPYFKYQLVKGETLYYVCRNQTCDLPVRSIDEVLDKIRNQS